MKIFRNISFFSLPLSSFFSRTTVISLNREVTEPISSPTFPWRYDNDIDIAWQIVAPPGYRVHAHFSEFETESNDYLVDVHEGWTSDFSKSTLRASLSGRSVPNNITSMGTYLWIRFISNETYRCYGFCGFQVLLSAEIPGEIVSQAACGLDYIEITAYMFNLLLMIGNRYILS